MTWGKYHHKPEHLTLEVFERSGSIIKFSYLNPFRAKLERVLFFVLNYSPTIYAHLILQN
jgi:hypothetical protein